MFTKVFATCIIALSVASTGIIFYEYTTQTLDYTYDSFSQVKEQK